MVVSQGRQRWLGRTEDRGEGNEAERDETALLHSDPRRYGMHRHARHAHSGEEADALGERDLAAGDADDDDEWNGEDVLEESDAKIGLLDSVVEETFVDTKSDVSEAIRGEPRNARERGGLVARGVEDTRTCDDTKRDVLLPTESLAEEADLDERLDQRPGTSSLK